MPSRFIGSRLYGKSCHLVLVLMNEKEDVNSSNIFDNLVQKEHNNTFTEPSLSIHSAVQVWKRSAVYEPNRAKKLTGV